MDEVTPGTRRTSREFDEFEHRALRGWSHMWDGGFNDVEREAFVPNYRRMVTHMDAVDKAEKAAADAVPENLAKRRFNTTLRWTVIATLLVGAQVAVAAFTRSSNAAPQQIVVRLPSGQSVTVTPLPAPTISPIGGPIEP